MSDTDQPIEKKASEYKETASQDSWDEGGSLSLSMSKDSGLEETALPEGEDPGFSSVDDSLSNERITKGTFLLETYDVISDAVKGGMGSVWKVHHNSWDTDLAMKRPQPKYFAEGSDRPAGEIHLPKEDDNHVGL